MRHLPISLDLRGKTVAIAGAGAVALSKTRLLLRTEATLCVYGEAALPEFVQFAAVGKLQLVARPLGQHDLATASLVYAASGDDAEDKRVAGLAQATGVLCNSVDNLEASDFLTPAIVDRDPVTVAIGTEGCAPVLARQIKADFEASLTPNLGILARLAERFRPQAAALPSGASRRRFWSRFFGEAGPRALEDGGEQAAWSALEALAAEAQSEEKLAGHVHLVGAGPGDPELLTLKARRLLHEADVVIYDRLVSAQVLELARREARLISVGKTPGGPSWKQPDICALIVSEAQTGAQVVRLKSGDPGVYGRLDEEMDALDAAGIGFYIVPGITAATAAAASAKVSLTRRGRNTALRILTGHDINGFVEHDWRALAAPGSTAAIYMGVAAAKFLQGRLLMHGASTDTPMCVVENASAPNQTIAAATLSDLTVRMTAADITGPAILFLGLAPRSALAAVSTLSPSPSTALVAGGIR